MVTADAYRMIAAELKAKAAKENNGQLAAELENLAVCYLRLAERVDQNRPVDLWAEYGREPMVEKDDH